MGARESTATTPDCSQEPGPSLSLFWTLDHKTPGAWPWKRQLWQNHPRTLAQRGPQGRRGPSYPPWLAQAGAGSRVKGRMRAGSQIPPRPCPSNPGHGCPGQACPESEFPHVPDRPEYGVPQALCSLASLGPGIGGWAPPEGVKGSSQIQGPGGGSGAVLRPVSGRPRGSEIPGGRTPTRWTETSKASSSCGPRLQRGRH